jgi:hypothetical protein
MKRFVIAAISGVGVGVACAFAGPLNKGRVDAEAKWVVHADLDAVMASRTGRFIAAHKAEMDLGPLEEFKKKTGLDAFRDIHGVTVYGTTESPDEAVAIIHGNDKVESAVNALMAGDETVAKVELGGRAVFRWTEDGSDRYGYLKRGDGNSHMFVVSKASSQLERALKVMDGGGASMATVKDGPMASLPRRGAMVYVVMRDLDSAAAFGPKILRTAKNARAELGEDEEGLYGELRITAGEAEDAKNIADFGRGLIALGKMASQGDPELKDLVQVMEGIKLEAKGTELMASFRIGNELLDAALLELKDQAKDGGAATEKVSKKERVKEEKPRR